VHVNKTLLFTVQVLMQELTEKVTNGETAVTFMPSQRDTALSGRKARSVLRARNAPMLPMPIPSAPKLISDICNERTIICCKISHTTCGGDFF